MPAEAQTSTARRHASRPPVARPIAFSRPLDIVVDPLAAGPRLTLPQGARLPQSTPLPTSLPPWVATPSIPSITDAGLAARGSPRAACLTALRSAERRHNLPPGLLVAIALNESGLHAHALSIRGRAYFPDTRAEADRLLLASGGGSVMAGCLQINAGVHARGQTWPLDPRAAADWAANFLTTNHQRTGDWAEVLRRWHGASARNAGTYLCRVRGKLEVVQPDSPIFAEQRCAPANMARLRQNGAAHLEIAEAR
ncbi:lytic transglycosylase domain-containing protein [Roseomonas arctica]|uniref:Lytic transglycosylase domain-containing protein n=2 Tax=Plastoroseomonas arctica TaxID=1509237 RepID=A0AAF1K6X2_9PROT|nr:lytic transglycosylase domain-containing protein [Plastoroseomonas arctica]